jgi:hypothetical protein
MQLMYLCTPHAGKVAHPVLCQAKTCVTVVRSEVKCSITNQIRVTTCVRVQS